MLLMPDPATANIDPFFEESTLIMSCDVVEPGDGKAYDRDPRSIAKRAEAYLKASGMGDTAFFGPEPEFFIFDGVRWSTEPGNTFYKIEEYEAPWNTGAKLEGGNRGHRPTVKGGYFPVPPVDSTQDMRAEMSLVLESLGIPVEVFHHEVAGAGQNEIGTKFSTLVSAPTGRSCRSTWSRTWPMPTARPPPSCPSPTMATTAPACTCTSRSGKTARTCSPATAMPACPTLRCTTSAASSSTPARSTPSPTPAPTATSAWCPFRGAGQAGLFGQEPLGLDPHPVRGQPQGPPRRGPLPRSPDEPLPGLCGLLMAGLDGMENKIHPGEAATKDLYHLPPEEDKLVPTVCHSLDQALEARRWTSHALPHRAFLTKGGVFYRYLVPRRLTHARRLHRG
jgi:glutamine synthetase